MKTLLGNKLLYWTRVLPPDPEDIHKILLIRFSALGDIIHTTPVVSAVRSKFPHSKIYYLLDKRYKDLFIGNPMLDGILTVNRQMFKKSTVIALKGIYQLIRDIREYKFDLVIDLHGFNETALLSFISGSPYRLGKTIRNTRYCYNLYPAPSSKPLKHPMDQYNNLLQPLNIFIDEPRLQVYLSQDDEKFAERFFKVHGLLDNGQDLAFNLGGSHAKKRWPPHQWAALGDKLCDMFTGKIILAVGPMERKLAMEVQYYMKNRDRTIILQTSIRKYASVIKRMKLLISADSGPLHIGVAVNIPTVSLVFNKNRGNFRSLKSPQVLIPKNRIHDLTSDEVLETMKDFFYKWVLSSDGKPCCLPSNTPDSN